MQILFTYVVLHMIQLSASISEDLRLPSPCFPNNTCNASVVINVSLYDEATVEIYFPGSNTAVQYDIIFIPTNGDCYQPSISFSFFDIDNNNPFDEFLNITDNTGTQIESCVGEQSHCNTTQLCIDQEPLSISSIAMDTLYTVSIISGHKIDSACSPEFNASIIANLTLHCDMSTAPSSTDIQTSTTVTEEYPPLASPCFPNDICQASFQMESLSETVEIYYPGANTAVKYDIIFIPVTDCFEPSISFSFLDIDNNNPYEEFLNITDNDGVQIESCIGTQSHCNFSILCMDRKRLTVSSIAMNTLYKVSIISGPKIDRGCSPKFNASIVANLTLHCEMVITSSTTASEDTTTEEPTSEDPSGNNAVNLTTILCLWVTVVTILF